MRFELTMQVRGGSRSIRWHEGELTGDDEVLRRLQILVDEGRVDVTDLLSVVRATELVTAQHVSIANLDLIEPDLDLVEPDRTASVPPASVAMA